MTAGHSGVVLRWLENGGEVNMRVFNGLTMLFGACSHAHCNVVEVLLEAQADVNIQDANGFTALMSAAGNHQYGNEDDKYAIVRQLLQART